MINMRIGFLVIKNLLRGGGIEKYTYEVGRRLVKRGHEIVVFSMGHYGEVPPEIEGMRLVRVPSIPGSSAERLTASMSSVVEAMTLKPRLDVIHLHTPMTGAFGLLPRILGRPTVLQMHGIDWQRSRWGSVAKNVIWGLEQVAVRAIPTRTAVSQTQCAFYLKYYGRDMAFIPTGSEMPPSSADSDEIRRLGLEPGKYILFAARLVPEKGAHYLIEAFRNVPTDHKLVIAGGAKDQEEYQRKLDGLAGNDPRILFPGYVEGELKHQLFRHTALYCQPSEIEGLSIALLEAMSYGLRCLVSDIPENIEAIGPAGYTFHSRNSVDLQAKIAELLALPLEQDSLAQRARERVEKLYSWDHVTDQLEELYRSAICRTIGIHPAFFAPTGSPAHSSMIPTTPAPQKTP